MVAVVPRDGQCFPEAVIAANTDMAVDGCPSGNGADTIALTVGIYELGIPGFEEDESRTGDLDITEGLLIRGLSRFTTHIDANDLDRVFDVRGPIVVRLEDLDIHGGDVVLERDHVHGDGGAIRNDAGNLTLLRMRVEGDAAPQAGCMGCADGQGGAIANGSGRLTVLDSVLLGVAGDGGGALSNAGGVVIIRRSHLTGEAVGGGGIRSRAGSVTLVDSTIESAGANFGGGISAGYSGSATVVVRGSIIRGNAGSGIFMRSGTLSISDSEITDNFAGGEYASGAGGIYIGDAAVDLTRVIVARNRGSDSGGIHNARGVLTVRDSLIADNFHGQSEGGAGGIASLQPESYTTVINTTISGNESNADVGGLRITNGLVRSSTIVGNTGAWRGGVTVVDGSASFANTVIAGNKGQSADCTGTLTSGA
jgi:hypothetical protein